MEAIYLLISVGVHRAIIVIRSKMLSGRDTTVKAAAAAAPLMRAKRKQSKSC